MKLSLFVIGTALLLTSCVDRWGDEAPSPDSSSLEDVVIDESFNYRTTSEVKLAINVVDNQDRPLQGVDLTISYVLDTTQVEVGKVLTSASGRAEWEASLPSWVEEVTVSTGFVGLPNEHRVTLQAGDNELFIGGAPQENGRTSYPRGRTSLPVGRTTAFGYLSNYDQDGVPNNLLPVDDYISQDLLDLVNSTLPEQYPVPTYNPQYLENDIGKDVLLRDSAEVWVTFVHEGAGWRNSLGFYQYDLDSPPQSVEDINSLQIIFPNTSFKGSGGNLNSGNKVSLGTFSANTGIGWFLVPNAWNGTEVTERSDVKYSNKEFNTFTSAAFRQHTVLLKDEIREILLLGIEDTSRPAGDNDFNDAVFYVSANPFAAIITDDLETTQTTGNDSDNDGVSDANDEYPNDPTRAFNVYTPGDNLYGTVAFEDNWPQRGDYDMNDVVIDYQYQMVTNASNQVVDMIGNFELVATGASFDNGFGLALPVEASQVNTATLTGTGIDGSVSALEADQTSAVFILFEDAHEAMQADGPVNTIQGKETLPVASYQLMISFVQPIGMNQLGFAPFDPFIFVDKERSREVHLPDFAPTDLANNLLLGSQADTSDPQAGRYYKSQTNLPWAIYAPVKFEYPVEYSPINQAHLQFVNWAESSGLQYKDWYMPTNGYRRAAKIYTAD